MGFHLAEENTGWEAALEIAANWNKNVQRLCQAVLKDDYKTAKLLAKELKDEESTGTVESINRRASRRG